MPKYQLTSQRLNQVRVSIKEHAEAFGINEIEINSIGSIPGGRKLVEAAFWPIMEALTYFEQQGAGKIEVNNFKIIDSNYFNIKISDLSLPVKFSIDRRISSSLLTMTGLYAQIYDIENRLRFYITQKIQKKYGNVFEHLPPSVQTKITSEKARLKIFVTDPRIFDLEYTDFSHLKDIFLANPDFIKPQKNCDILKDKLEYLYDVRNLIAHNNLIFTNEIQKIKDSCNLIKRILSMTA